MLVVICLDAQLCIQASRIQSQKYLALISASETIPNCVLLSYNNIIQSHILSALFYSIVHNAPCTQHCPSIVIENPVSPLPGQQQWYSDLTERSFVNLGQLCIPVAFQQPWASRQFPQMATSGLSAVMSIQTVLTNGNLTTSWLMRVGW